MAGTTTTLLRLSVILLCLSHLLCLQAIPITRSENLMRARQVLLALPENTHKAATQWEEPRMNERMDLELHDYPPSGANGRHTPRAP